MSNSKPLLPPFTFDLLCYLNRDQLERFSMVCRSLKDVIDRYFRSKPYRIFDELIMRGGSYALRHNYVQWHPNRHDYSVQQFLAGQKCSIDNSRTSYTYYSFTEMSPYLGPTVRINWTFIFVGGRVTYTSDHIAEMESIAYLWRDGNICIRHRNRIGAEDFQPVLNSQTILQCRELRMDNAHFSFRDYKVLYTVQVIRMFYQGGDIDLTHLAQFLEQPGVKPVVFVARIDRANITNLLDLLYKAFSSAVVTSPFKVIFSRYREDLTEFREINKTSGEKLELKKRVPIGYERLNLTYENYIRELYIRTFQHMILLYLI